MNGATLIIAGTICLIAGYIFYGRWLARKWGVDPSRKTPAHEIADGLDYSPARRSVLLGHHFSSIAGAGPITGPIQAAVFGWIPVALWVIIGGIFIGATHDFGSLLASVRSRGQSIGTIISNTMGRRAKRLFLIFAYLTLVLVIAAFTSIVAGTFEGISGTAEHNRSNGIAATSSILFILFAVILGILSNRYRLSSRMSTLLTLVFLLSSIIIGISFPIYLSESVWIAVIAAYIVMASILPVWMLLQPRDFMCSFLLYGLMGAAIIGILLANPTMNLPGFTSFETNIGYLFPALFITVACGAVSGFHSLVASGTTSKQLDSERDTLPIGYGSMLIECVLALVALVCVGMLFTDTMPNGTPTEIFAGGIASIISSLGLESYEALTYSLVILVVSSFAMTSLDTATRLGRMLFQELVEPADDSEPLGLTKMLGHPAVATIITVCLGVGLALVGYQNIWGLFGSANQLLAVLAILAICAWLGNAGLENRMLYIPMVFMLLATLTSLILTIYGKLMVVMDSFDTVALIQAVIAIFLFILALVLMKDGVKVLRGQRDT